MSTTADSRRPSRRQRAFPSWLPAVAVLAVVAVFVFGDLIADSAPGDSQATSESTMVTDAGNDTATDTGRAFSELAKIEAGTLPIEARNTLDLILDGGPFPFSRDDTVFQNRERLLPIRPEGYYREYTVITPGEDDRGPRRIVAGADGGLYFTVDHYDSFVEIIGVNR